MSHVNHSGIKKIGKFSYLVYASSVLLSRILGY